MRPPGHAARHLARPTAKRRPRTRKNAAPFCGPRRPPSRSVARSLGRSVGRSREAHERKKMWDARKKRPARVASASRVALGLYKRAACRYGSLAYAPYNGRRRRVFAFKAAESARRGRRATRRRTARSRPFFIWPASPNRSPPAPDSHPSPSARP